MAFLRKSVAFFWLYKTYFLAGGLCVVALYLAIKGEGALAAQAFLGALTAMGLRHDITNKQGGG